jgi:hypothetical protein
MAPGNVCSPSDGECHCGTADGPICGINKCQESECVVYVIDGGPLAPGEDAGGAPVYGECFPGDPCHCVTCPALEHCDVNNNGACECGGDSAENMPGVVCAANQTCVASLIDGGEPTCQ